MGIWSQSSPQPRHTGPLRAQLYGGPHRQDWFCGSATCVCPQDPPSERPERGLTLCFHRLEILNPCRTKACVFILALGPTNDTVDTASGHGASYPDRTHLSTGASHGHVWDGRYCCGHFWNHHLPLGSCRSLSPECLCFSFPPEPLGKAPSMLGPTMRSLFCLSSHRTL